VGFEPESIEHESNALSSRPPPSPEDVGGSSSRNIICRRRIYDLSSVVYCSAVATLPFVYFIPYKRRSSLLPRVRMWHAGPLYFCTNRVDPEGLNVNEWVCAGLWVVFCSNCLSPGPPACCQLVPGTRRICGFLSLYDGCKHNAAR